MKKIILFVLLTFSLHTFSQITVPISANEWKIWLDENALWEHDKLFLPPYNLAEIPTNKPSCGWENLEKKNGITTKVPATVEQFYWGKNGGDFGITGDYVGVSWFTTNFDIPNNWKDKRIVLNFESARLRAEVYVNQQLAGYELINGTPFDVDISKFVKLGAKNQLAVRITDPNGNFAWRDWDTFKWGKYDIQPSHGFGGITGNVSITATDRTWIDDIFVKNTPKANCIEPQISISNQEIATGGEINISITEYGKDKVLFSQNKQVNSFEKSNLLSSKITLTNAKLWSPSRPNLYSLHVKWKGKNGTEHKLSKRFGFRWFDVKEVNGDKMFFLNGKRIILHTAISWSHWPENGIFPTKEMAVKQIQAAKNMGMNMLTFHRGIGQEPVFDAADELGLLYYEEPGGYRPGESEFNHNWKREKLLRMIKRDRSRPSLVIYNMINESARDPFPNEIEDIKAAHKLDETRCITFTTTYFGPKFYNNEAPLTEAPVKMHMLPYDHKVYNQGWWDKHHADGPGVYMDKFYKGATNFERYINNPSEIIFYGEEGAIGTPPRLQLIKEELDKTGKYGWNGKQMMDQYRAFDEFIAKKGFRNAFPTVDALCTKLGEVALYYQGRMMENVRISNIIDGWATNGWESTKIENHSGIVDLYRNPKADPKIMAYYDQPLYVAVKILNKVIEKGSETLVDFHLVNEKDIKGKLQLKVCASDKSGNYHEQQFAVKASGGVIYGELLKEKINFKIRYEGYTTIKAILMKDGKEIASGSDQIYAVELINPIQKVAVADTSATMQKMLKNANIDFEVVDLTKGQPTQKMLFVGGGFQPGFVKGNFRQDDPMMDWVARGNTLIIIKEAAAWCDYLNMKEVAAFNGSRKLGINWFGGNFFVRENPYFKGLPINKAFNWEYQCFAAYARHREGLRLENDECLVGAYSDHKNELYSAFSIIPMGKGQIIVSSLDFQAAMLSGERNAVVATKILQNMVDNTMIRKFDK